MYLSSQVLCERRPQSIVLSNPIVLMLPPFRILINEFVNYSLVYLNNFLFKGNSSKSSVREVLLHIRHGLLGEGKQVRNLISSP